MCEKLVIKCAIFAIFRYDFEHNEDEKVHLDCFCVIAFGIKVFMLKRNFA